jgi:Amt family ammonium transporter
MIGGMLTAMVAVSTGCTLISAWAAWLYGVMSGLIFTSMSKLYIRLKIDDPVDAITIFGFGGMFGLFATAFFDTEDGVFYWGKHELGMNVLGIVSIFGWIGLHSLVLLGVLRIFNLLREDAGVELMGQD